MVSAWHLNSLVTTKTHPKFSGLPLDSFRPTHSAWGLWRMDDELGTLNHLTPDRTLLTAKKIKTGIRDDRLTFNMQTSNQWDGLRHWGFADGRFYNGLTQKGILDKKSSLIGIHGTLKALKYTKQGIIGRGVLIDIVAYATRSNINYDPLGNYAWHARFSFSTTADIVKVSQQPSNPPLSPPKKPVISKSPFQYLGLESTLEILTFLWDTQIAAVTGDCPSFEAWPPSEQAMYQTLLSGFIIPIGEIFDLEQLAKECEKQQRWTFFFTGQVLNVKGGLRVRQMPPLFFRL
ncbi:hypothetical protein EJ02DRAFT_498940 [Clathrospora elynae]|uniref:Cyclase n=1 Tax=Clathrospora elynae TaxID=706981 RepID=A0A6A5T474_9PLEO|nr:hypothetical protein EJ02DRAFT_498940 [Clathrospora elynae]